MVLYDAQPFRHQLWLKMNMQILNIAGYKFTELSALPLLQEDLQSACQANDLKGTILLSNEGININLAGGLKGVADFTARLTSRDAFADMRFHRTYSTAQPFKRLKVKLKKEIITFRQGEAATPLERRAPDIAPAELKRWLDEQRDITLLDTRNDYEFRFGAFAGAVNLQIDQFGELPQAIRELDKTKPLVMYCTGGIRCEKAAVYMENLGFNEVYQLDRGILGYFADVGGAHYDGECFVFDERVALAPDLLPHGTKQCPQCQGPVSLDEQGGGIVGQGQRQLCHQCR
jgi:UPF0176 protein